METTTDAFGRRWTMGSGPRCEARSPVSGLQCSEDAGHDGRHGANHNSARVGWTDTTAE